MAATKKIVLKVCIMCVKCKVCVMTTVSKFCGIDSVAVDAEKSTMTIVGSVDAALIVKALRKKKKPVEIVSVGEPDKGVKKDDKKEDKKEVLPPCCKSCSSVVIYGEPDVCIIL